MQGTTTSNLENPMTAMSAMTRDLSRRAVDHGDPLSLDLALKEARRQFHEAQSRLLEAQSLLRAAKRRYLRLTELELLCRRERSCVAGERKPAGEILSGAKDLELDQRHLRKQEEPAGPRETLHLPQELTENVLRLQKLKELIRLREIRLQRQQRAHRLRDRAEAARRRRQDPELRDNVLKLQKLKALVHLYEILHRPRRSLHTNDRALHPRNRAGSAAVPQPPNRDRFGNAQRKCRRSVPGVAQIPAVTQRLRIKVRPHVFKNRAGRVLRLCELPLRELWQHHRNPQHPWQLANQPRRCLVRSRFSRAQNLIARGPPCRAYLQGQKPDSLNRSTAGIKAIQQRAKESKSP